ncbi:MAG: hypothetical protein JSS00_01420 [Proteobacteria bacterium]|nr:hypothetical protein [Pseudomonadota bacterium]
MSGNNLRWAAKRVSLELLRALPDSVAISVDYFRVFGTFPNLAQPRRFSEKMQHMKLHARHGNLSDFVDKVRVKEYVRRKLGDSWLIPTLWHGEVVTEEAVRSVPKPAVMKSNHSSAQIYFLNDSSDVAEAVRTANGWLRYDHHVLHREWAYGQVARKILIEPFVGDGEAPEDYKFWVLDGAVRFVQVDQARFTGHTRQFYTPDWRRLDVKLKYPNSPDDIPAPPHLKDMTEAARTPAGSFRFVRVDLYDRPQKPLFGELTFTPEAGLCRFDPPEFDIELGASWLYPRPAFDAKRPPAPARLIAGVAPSEMIAGNL